METQKANKTVHSVFTAFFAALISVGAFISIPAGPLGISIVLQNMLCVLSGCILGGIQGAAAVGLFIAAGFKSASVMSKLAGEMTAEYFSGKKMRYDWSEFIGQAKRIAE